MAAWKRMHIARSTLLHAHWARGNIGWRVVDVAGHYVLAVLIFAVGCHVADEGVRVWLL